MLELRFWKGSTPKGILRALTEWKVVERVPDVHIFLLKWHFKMACLVILSYNKIDLLFILFTGALKLVNYVNVYDKPKNIGYFLMI